MRISGKKAVGELLMELRLLKRQGAPIGIAIKTALTYGRYVRGLRRSFEKRKAEVDQYNQTVRGMIKDVVHRPKRLDGVRDPQFTAEDYENMEKLLEHYSSAANLAATPTEDLVCLKLNIHPVDFRLITTSKEFVTKLASMTTTGALMGVVRAMPTQVAIAGDREDQRAVKAFETLGKLSGVQKQRIEVEGKHVHLHAGVEKVVEKLSQRPAQTVDAEEVGG